MTVPEEKEQNKKQKHSYYGKHISKHISEFMNNSSIHGLKYLVGSDRTIFEKILWFVVVFISVSTCSLMINSVWQKWEENPAFISAGQNPVWLWEIPFPAVTVCLSAKFNKESNYTFLYTADKKNWQTGNVSSYCKDIDKKNVYLYTEFQLGDYFEGQKWEEYLLQTAIQPKQFLRYCYFAWGKTQLSPFLTNGEVCYSFNMLDKKDFLRNVSYVPSVFGNQNNISSWTFDNNYLKTNESVYPHRSRNIDDKLRLSLNTELNKVRCLGNNRYYIQLHHPAETPTMDNSILIETNKIYDILIKPDITITAESLKTYSPYRKKCYFSDERYLHFYKIYTQENCKLECLANYTLRNCGCVPAELPHNKTTKLCGRISHTSRRCVIESEDTVFEIESGLSQNNLYLPLCNCLPSCNLIIYNAEVSVRDSLLNMTHTSIHVQFKTTQFNVLERQELFGDVNFWASCGGILGLFIGFSVVSIAEIIYYLFFRWLCSLGRWIWGQLHPNRLVLSTVL